MSTFFLLTYFFLSSFRAQPSLLFHFSITSDFDEDWEFLTWRVFLLQTTLKLIVYDC